MCIRDSRYLLNHYRLVHANHSSFNVNCNIDGCPSTFSIYNSLYKHVTRKHKEIYYQQNLDANEFEQPSQENEAANQEVILNDDNHDNFANNDIDNNNDSLSSLEKVEEEMRENPPKKIFHVNFILTFRSKIFGQITLL